MRAGRLSVHSTQPRQVLCVSSAFIFMPANEAVAEDSFFFFLKCYNLTLQHPGRFSFIIRYLLNGLFFFLNVLVL